MSDPTAPFEAWLLHRVAEAVEGGEVSAALLTDLHAAIAEVPPPGPPEVQDPLALLDLAERVNLSVAELANLLATLEAQPIAARERCLRGFVEAWLRCSSGKSATRNHTEGMMAEVLGGRRTVSLEEAVLAQAFQLDALRNVLGRQGFLKKGEWNMGR